MPKFKPSYLKLLETKELQKRIEKLYRILESCELCPRKCNINRLKEKKGYCGTGRDLVISGCFSHFGEEAVLVGENGSGTIFLAGCNLKCVYCQNYEISYLKKGRKVSEEDCAQMMLKLQKEGCHNINFVTPTHFAPQIVKAIKIAAENGFTLPIIWNCGGYENIEVIKLLEGIVDIYMPDFKYGGREAAERYSNAPDYFEREKEAIKEMQRQVGSLQIDKNGIAFRGLLVRHLVLPDDLAESEKILEFLAKEISKNTYVNIMAQYWPCGDIAKFPELNRRITRKEYSIVINIARKLGLSRGFDGC